MNAGITENLELKPNEGPPRSILGQVQAVGCNSDRSTSMSLEALVPRLPVGSAFTELERIALAVTATRPTNFLTLSTIGASQENLAYDFRLLVRRIEGRKSRPKVPLIYFGSFAQGKGHGGYHLHLLLWDRPHLPMYHGQTRAVGLGHADAVQIIPSTPENVLRVVSYTLGQQEPVFGSKPHKHHRPREQYKRRFIHPQMKTLEKYHPELFVALNLAKDKSVSDETLVEKLPILVRALGHKKGSEEASSS